MRHTKILYILLLLFFSGCVKDTLFEKNIVGFWKIKIYTKTIYQDNTPLLSECTSEADAGTMEFRSNGTGWYNLVKIMGYGAYEGYGEFTWTNTSTSVTIFETSTNKVFRVISNSSGKVELKHTDNNFYFPGHSSEYEYSLEEFISLAK